MSTTNSSDLGGFSKQYAARDLPAHQKLKYRDIGQAAPDEIRKDKKELRKQLEERERIAINKADPSKQYLSILDSDKSSSLKKPKVEPNNPDADEVLPDSDSEDESARKKKKRNVNNNKNTSDTESEDDGRQSDDETSEKSDSDDDDDEDDDNDEDEDDETEALMAELNRIKQERAAEAARLEAERKAREEQIRVENILKGNPLLNSDSTSKSLSESVDFKVKRRWDDDVVFKNCAKGDVSGNKKKDFINDTLRSEFHKKFMDRYIK